MCTSLHVATVWSRRYTSAPGFPSHLRHEETRFPHFPICICGVTRSATVGSSFENFLVPSSFCAGSHGQCLFFSILLRTNFKRRELEIYRRQSGRFLKLLAPFSQILLPGRSRPAVNGYGWRATALNGHWLLVRHSPIGRATSPRAAVRPPLHLTSSCNCSVMECSKAHRPLTLLSLRTIPLKAMVSQSQEMVQVTGISHRLPILRALKSIEKGMTTRPGTHSESIGSLVPQAKQLPLSPNVRVANRAILKKV